MPQLPTLSSCYLDGLGIALHLLKDHPHGGVRHNLLHLRVVHGPSSDLEVLIFRIDPQQHRK